MDFRLLYKKHQQLSNFLILLIPTLVFIAICVYSLISLYTGSYILHQKDLYLLKDVAMLDRAHWVGKNHSSIKFQDERWKTFMLDGSAMNAVKDREELFDTMQYSSLVMSVWTDSDGSKTYTNSKKDDFIKVYGISVGNVSYVNLKDLNEGRRKRLIELPFAFFVFYLIYLTIHFYRILNPGKIKAWQNMQEKRAEVRLNL